MTKEEGADFLNLSCPLYETSAI